MKSLAIIVTHPIQYYVPVFQQLAKRCNIKVFYTWGSAGAVAKYDPDFQQNISWDLPLLAGYPFEFIKNTAKDPGSHHFKGIVNPDLIDLVKDFRPHAILIYGWAYQSHLAVMRHFKGKTPVWFRGDSTLLDQTGTLRKVFRKLSLTWIYRHIDLVFYVGKANKAYFKAFGVKENQLIFAPHAVDNVRFAIDRSAEASKLRHDLGISANDPLILFAGKFEEKKNPLLLLQAFLPLNQKIKNDHQATNNDKQQPNNEKRKTKNEQRQTKNEQRTTTNEKQTTTVHLLFVGNGALEKKLKSHASQNQDTVHFLNFQNQSQMPVIYQACDLFCLPSQGPGETWGLVVNEAMAAGKTILVADKVGCAEDLIIKGTNGEIFKSADLTDLKSKLQALLSNRPRLKEMGLESEKLISKWSIDKQAEIIAKTLNESH